MFLFNDIVRIDHFHILVLDSLTAPTTSATSSNTPLLTIPTSTSPVSNPPTTLSASTIAPGSECNQDNCLRAFIHSSLSASSLCQVYIVPGTSVTLQAYASQCSYLPSRASSACSCRFTSTTSQSTISSQSTSSSTASSSSSLPSTSSPISQTSSSTTPSSSAAASSSGFSGSSSSPSSTSVAVVVSDSSAYTASVEIMPPNIIAPSNSIPTVTNIELISAATKWPIAWADNSQSDGSKFTLVMNITATDNSSLVNIEDFIPFVSSIDCGSEDIEITFSSSAAFLLAVNSWPVNFTLVTSGSEYCGTDIDHSGRTFYKYTTSCTLYLLIQIQR
jgi:hypothetical protein